MSRWFGLAVAAGCAVPPPVTGPVVLRRPTGVASYSSPTECFRSMIVVSPHESYEREDQADLSFPYHGDTVTATVPIELGETIAREPQRSYELCVVPITVNAFELYPIEVGTGDTLLWHGSDNYDVRQKLVWSADGHDLLVELGDAMEMVYSTPFRDAGIVRVGAPAALRDFPLDKTYQLVVHVEERRAGATVKLIEVDDYSGAKWNPVWTRALHKE